MARDGFTGYKTAAAEEIPAATAVMDPCHVVALAGEKTDQCRQRVQQATVGHRGRCGDPLYGIRKLLRTGAGLLTSRQTARLQAVFACDAHVEVEVTWGVYQSIVAVYRDPDWAAGKHQMQQAINFLARGVPESLAELITLGKTLNQRAADVLAFFDHPVSSNGPTEAINGRLEHLRGTAPGLPEPLPLHHSLPARHRRLQNRATPSSVQSLFRIERGTEVKNSALSLIGVSRIALHSASRDHSPDPVCV